MRVKPEKGYLVCQAVESNKLSSGIYVPDSQKDKKKYLQVTESASDRYKKKDLIIPKSQMMAIEVELQPYYIVHEDDICATLIK